jgi:hypothetical protein
MKATKTDEQRTLDMIAFLPFDCLSGAVFIEGLPEGTVIEIRDPSPVRPEPVTFEVRRK